MALEKPAVILNFEGSCGGPVWAVSVLIVIYYYYIPEVEVKY